MSVGAAVPADIAQLLEKVGTGMVMDALAMAGIKAGIPGVRPTRGFEDTKIFGPAVTIHFGPPRYGVQRLNNYVAIAAAAAGGILVIDGHGYDGHFTGDIQGELAKRQGLLGIVVFGGARDLAGYRRMGLPLYCTGSATRDKPADLQMVAYDVPVDLAGVTVTPGDIILADEDGVVAIPREALAILSTNMQVISEIEAGMNAAIRRNAPVDELTTINARKRPRGG